MPMEVFISFALLIGGLVVLIFGGELLVRGATNIAYSLQISPLVVGLTVVAFGTSAPELIISVSSALHGADELSLGNVVGSNICNLALVMGITALFYPIPVDSKSLKIDWVVTIGAGLLLQFFISRDYTLSRFEGIIFLFILVIYTYFLIEMSRREMKEKAAENNEEIEDVKGWTLMKEIGLFLFGCALLYVGAELLFVKGASRIAVSLGMDDRMIGLTIVALGTSLPELVASGVAAFKKDTDLALGNLMGSCIFNILSILGFTSLISEIQDGGHSIVDSDIWWMLGLFVLVFPLMAIRKKIGRVEGAILLSFYFIYMGYLIYNEYYAG